MKKKSIILIIVLLISLITILVFLNNLNNRYYEKKIIGLWSNTYLSGDIEYYTQEFIINEDKTIYNRVIRPDNSEDTYNLGIYKIKGKRILYKNVDYEKGFGPKYYELEYDKNNDLLFIIEAETRAMKFERID